MYRSFKKLCVINYDRRLIEENGSDHSAFWKTVKKILPGESKSVSSGITLYLKQM